MHTAELSMNKRIAMVAAIAATIVVVFGVWLAAQGSPQPAFGQLVASPPNIVYNSPTNVTFTIRIATPTLNPTTVQLQKIDNQGNELATVGRLYDDATHGDQVGGDKVFTSTVSLNEPTIGKSYFRVIAAFRGNQLNAQSPLVALDVDPFPLPPDPGEAGKRTLEGIDSDNDGVRDDVQRYIGLSFPNTARVRAALSQGAAALQEMILSAENPAAARVASSKDAAALQCLTATLKAQAANTQSHLLEAVFLNTAERIGAYYTSARYPAPVDVESELLGSDLVSFCSVDPSTLAN